MGATEMIADMVMNSSEDALERDLERSLAAQGFTHTWSSTLMNLRATYSPAILMVRLGEMLVKAFCSTQEPSASSRILPFVECATSLGLASGLHVSALIVKSGADYAELARQIEQLRAFSCNPTTLLPTNEAIAVGELIGPVADLLHQRWSFKKHAVMKAMMGTASSGWSTMDGWSMIGTVVWMPLYLLLEKIVEGRRISAACCTAHLATAVISLRAVEGASWGDAILALWLAALRTLSRARVAPERVESRLSLALVLIPAAIRAIMDSTDIPRQLSASSAASLDPDVINTPIHLRSPYPSNPIRAALARSIELLSNFEALLSPPFSAQIAAAKAAREVSNRSGVVLGGGDEATSSGNRSGGGDMRDLIREACISRGLLSADSEEVKAQDGDTTGEAPQSSQWVQAAQAGRIDPLVRDIIVKSPAASVAEVEAAYKIAVSGVEEDSQLAATWLCGYVLVRSWHIQAWGSSWSMCQLQRWR